MLEIGHHVTVFIEVWRVVWKTVYQESYENYIPHTLKIPFFVFHLSYIHIFIHSLLHTHSLN